MEDDSTVAHPDAVGAARGARSSDEVDGLVGATFDGFHVDAVLGRGGMGVVYRARDLRLDRDVALKTVKLASRSTLARLRREAKLQASLRHPNVVSVHTIGEHDGVPYLVMDLVEGEPLAEQIRRDGPLDEARALALVDAVAAALEAAHQRGLIHRDVKPGNILVDRSGQALLADFGLARTEDSSEANDAAKDALPASLRTHGIAGTPAYLAPEQARGEAHDHRADMYALGVSLYEMLTGARPPAATKDAPAPRFEAPSARTTASPATDALCMRLLAPAADARFASYAELRAAIADARANAGAPASLILRGVAAIFDVGPTVLLVGVVFAAVAAVIDLSPFARRVGVFPVAFVCAALGFGLLESRFGWTPAKRLLRLRVRRSSGGRLPLGHAILRNTFKLLPLAFVGLAAASPVPKLGAPAIYLYLIVELVLALRAGRTLHDRVAASAVVRASRFA